MLKVDQRIILKVVMCLTLRLDKLYFGTLKSSQILQFIEISTLPFELRPTDRIQMNTKDEISNLETSTVNPINYPSDYHSTFTLI